MHRTTRLALLALVAAACIVPLGRDADADVIGGYAIDRFEPAEHGSEWLVADALDLRGAIRPSLGVLGEWSWRPQVFHQDGRRIDLVGDQFFLHFGGALVFLDRFRFALDLPVVVDQSGHDVAAGSDRYLGPARSTNVGDLRISFDAGIFGKFGDAVRAAIGARLWAPTGDGDAYSGDGKLRFAPHVTFAGDARRFAWSITPELAIRPRRDVAFADTPIGSAFVVRAAAGVRFLDDHLLVGPETITSFDVSGAPGSKTVAPELFFGAHLAVREVRAGLGLGWGFGSASGVAALRMIASLEWVYEPRAPAPAKNPHEETHAPRCPPSDRATIEDVAAGCEMKDSDHDGIADGLDACPAVPGQKHLDPHKNGCPLDRDGDGIVDDQDACLTVRGVASKDPAKNGCPPDHDGDGVPDAQDACPDEPGVFDVDEKKNGCPPPVTIQSGQLKISAQIKFKVGSATLLKESGWILEAVAQTMKEHPEIKRLRVEGHTDDKGPAAANKLLSANRAAAVVKELVKLGVAKARLHSVGIGADKPIADNGTEEGRAANRRVEFHIEDAK